MAGGRTRVPRGNCGECRSVFVFSRWLEFLPVGILRGLNFWPRIDFRAKADCKTVEGEEDLWLAMLRWLAAGLVS